MKKLLILAGLLSMTTVAYAEDPYLELLRSDVRTQKVALVTEAMQLDGEESTAFWPVYREYEFEMSKTWDEEIALLKLYGKHYDNMTEEVAKELADRWFVMQSKRIHIQSKFFRKFEEAVSAVTAVRFTQIENRINLLIDLQISSQLPLIVK